MREINHAVFLAELDAQQVSGRDHYAFVCPMCATVQSARSLIDAGAGQTFEEVEKFLGFSCVGRWTGAGTPRRKPDGRPCNWTLGGLLQTHKLVVVHEGERYRRFEIASPIMAQHLERQPLPVRPTAEAL